MRYASVCSGIEAPTVAWHPLGWRPVFFSEIDAFPCAVLAHHYPDAPNYGDMTQHKEWGDAAVDVLVGGTPCQSFSVAGLRKGLDDPRGNLMLTFGAIACRYRPRWLVWENVPGVLSSNAGRDFGTLLGMLAELGYGFAYRVLDAQFFGLAQRRKRVFVVGCLGDWRRAAAVLFERASLSGNPPPRREAGKGTAAGPADCLTKCRAGSHDEARGTANLIAMCLNAKVGAGRQDAESETLIPTNGGVFDVAHSLRGEGFDASEDGTGRGTPLVPVQPYTLAVRGRGDSHELEYRQDGTANALLTPNGGRAGIGVGAVAFDARQSDVIQYGDKSGPLDTNGCSIGVLAFSAKDHGADATEGIAPTLRAMPHDGSHANGGGQVAVQSGMQVRRLTPRECERLQGFPDVHDLLRITVCEDASSELASSAALGSSHQSHALSGPVAVHVLIDSERSEVQLRSQGRCLWTASTAESESSYLLRLQSDAFARLVAGMKPMLARATRTGGAESRVSMTPSIAPSSGSAHVLLSGQEIAALANDAERFASVTQKFITSQAGRDSQACELNLRTLSCCVAVAISGCIPDSMRRGSSYDLLVEVVTPYTLIPYRGKPAADGPRYKALGNSMAVPVVRWIGQRIALVDELTNKGH